jgi:hypothetical protein
MGKVKRHFEGERSFSNYKRMHWVVCKTTKEEEIERFPRELERGKRAAWRTHFPRDLGHISQGRNFYFVSDEIYCCEGGHTVRICTVRTIEKWACFSRQGRHGNLRQLEDICY